MAGGVVPAAARRPGQLRALAVRTGAVGGELHVVQYSLLHLAFLDAQRTCPCSPLIFLCSSVFGAIFSKDSDHLTASNSHNSDAVPRKQLQRSPLSSKLTQLVAGGGAALPQLQATRGPDAGQMLQAMNCISRCMHRSLRSVISPVSPMCSSQQQLCSTIPASCSCCRCCSSSEGKGTGGCSVS